MTKTSKEREIALSRICLTHLQALGMGKPGEYIVGGAQPMSYTQVRKMCDRIAREISFEGRRKANDAAQVIDRIYATPSGIINAPV